MSDKQYYDGEFEIEKRMRASGLLRGASSTDHREQVFVEDPGGVRNDKSGWVTVIWDAKDRQWTIFAGVPEKYITTMFATDNRRGKTIRGQEELRPLAQPSRSENIRSYKKAVQALEQAKAVKIVEKGNLSTIMKPGALGESRMSDLLGRLEG